MSINEAPDPACHSEGDAGGVALVVEGKSRPIDKLDVTRVLPARERRAVGPFVFLDHMGPTAFAPGTGFDVRPHPHIGLSTVTYLFEGECVHRDSMGFVQTIRPGEINLMTSGRGVVHSERSPQEMRAHGGPMHGLQLWLALPTSHEEIDPSFEHHPRETLPEVTRDGVRARVLIGSALGATSPIGHPARPFMVLVDLEAGASFTIEPEGEERSVYIVEGEITAGRRSFGPQHLLVGAESAPIAITAARPSRIMALGGPALDGHRFLEWNFVSSSRERLERAKAAWRAQTFPKIPGDDQEYIPLPG